MWWYLIVVLIGLSLITNKVNHFFKWSLGLLDSLSCDMYVHFSLHFAIGLSLSHICMESYFKYVLVYNREVLYFILFLQEYFNPSDLSFVCV